MSSTSVNYIAVYHLPPPTIPYQNSTNTAQNTANQKEPPENASNEAQYQTHTEPICAVGYAYGEVWMLNMKELKRVQLGSFKIGTGSSKGNAKVLIRGNLALRNLLAFVGLKKCQKQTLQIWNVHTGRHIPIPPSPRLKGLGDVVYIRHAHIWLLVCGRGIGKGHLWKLEDTSNQEAPPSYSLQYLGSLTPRGNTLASMRFTMDGKMVITCTMENKVQIWTLPTLDIDASQTFDLRSAQAMSCMLDVDDISRHVGNDEDARALAIDILEEQNACTNLAESTVEEWISQPASRESWRSSLFPPRLLDPYAYDGQVDPLTRQPHGYGVKLDDFAGGKELLYEGLWKNGEPHGTGRLVDNRSGDICYIGGWKGGKRHGFGMEVKGANGERYEGWWRKDKRHGLGILHFSRSFSKSDKPIQYVGFFRNGHPHGLGWFTWPPGCKDWFNVPSKAIEHLGSIRCITQFKNGKFFDELNFHRADHVPITSNEANLLCHSFDSKKFAKHPDGRWEGEECWSCMLLASDATALICANPLCRMRVHTKCLPKSVRKFCSWENARSVYCDGEETLEAVLDEWFCPMQVCQDLCKAKVEQASYSRMADMETSESDGEEDPNDEEEEEEQAIETAGKASSDSNQGPPKKNRKPTSKRPRIKPFVAFANNRQNVAKLANIQGVAKFKSLWYFGKDGQRKFVLNDVDLEEALEECAKLRCEKLHIYGC